VGKQGHLFMLQPVGTRVFTRESSYAFSAS